MLRLPAEDFFSEIVTSLGETSSLGKLSLPLNKALKALKMARRSKWLGGNHCFDTASPRFIKLLRAA
jgi:hypothetical protein